MINHKRRKNGTILYWTGGTGTWNTSTSSFKRNSPTGSAINYTNSATSPKTVRLTTTANGTVTLNQATNIAKLSEEVGSGTTTISGSSVNKLNFIGGSATINVNSGGNLTINNATVNCDSALAKTGLGTLTMLTDRLDGYGTRLLQGVYSLAAAVAIGSTGSISMEGGTLQYTSNNTADYSSRFNHSSPGQAYNIDTNGQNITFSTSLSSPGSSLLKSGAGTLTLNKDSNFSSLTVSNGTLQLGVGGTAGDNINTIPVTISSGATLNRNFSSDKTINASGALVQGAGTLTKSGVGKLTMIGPHTYSGGTNINDGVLEVQGTNPIGTAGTIGFGGGSLRYTSTNTTDYSNRFSTAASQQYRVDTNGRDITFASNLPTSTCTLTKRGLGKLTLTGTNTFSNSFIASGSLQVGAGSTAGSITSPVNLSYDAINNVVAPMHSILSPDGTKLYAPSWGSTNSGIYVIDVATNSIIANIAADGALVGLAINSTGTRLYVTKYGTTSANNSGSSVHVIDTTTNSVIQTITVGGAPHGCAVSPDDKFLYVACETGNAIYRIDLSTYSPTNAVSVGSTCFGIAISSDGTKLYLGTSSSVIQYNVNTTTGALTSNATLTGFSNPYNMVRNGTTIYTSNYGSNTIRPISTINNSIGTSISVGSGPYGLTISSDGSTLCVANVSGNSISVISTATNTVTNTLSGFSAPRSAIKVGSKIFVTNNTSNLVSVIDTNGPVDLVVNRTGSLTMSNQISGYGNLIKNGSGTLALSASNSYTGTTSINAGVVNISNATAFGSSTSTINLSSGTELGISNNINLTRNLNLNGSVRNISGSNILSGSISLSGYPTVYSDAGDLTITNLMSSSSSGSVGVLSFDGPGNITCSNNIDIGTASILKSNNYSNSTGTVTLSGSNTFGNLRIMNGTLAATTANSLGSSTSILTIDSGATLDLSSVPTGTTITKSALNAGSGKIKFNIATGASSKLAINGDVNLSGTQIILNANSLPANGTIDILTYTGTLTGSPSTTTLVTGNGADFTGTVVNNTAQKKIQITVSALTNATTVYFELVGGGSGGAYNNTCAAGGGGGWVSQGNKNVTPGTNYSVIIGAGGAGRGTSSGYGGGAAGSASTFAGDTAPGAPAGCMNGSNSANNTAPTNGTNYVNTSGWVSPVTRPGVPSGGYQAWGGGGHTFPPDGADGGAGIHYTNHQTRITLGNIGLGYGGGGGCGGAGNNWGGGASSGGYGGQGCYPPGIPAYNAPANTGAGGGGGAVTANPAQGGSNGGSGVLTVRYPTTFKPATTTGSPIYLVTGGYRYYTFTGSGTITF